MVNADVIARKVLALNEALQHLSSVRGRATVDQLGTDALLQAAVERWLQVAIESCIDLAYHVIAERGWTPPDNARSAFEQLALQSIIDADLAKRLGRAAGMRNILVHDYVRVDRELLVRAITTALTDLPAFGGAVAALIE